MAVGFGQDRTDIDNRAGTLALGLRNTFRDIQSFYQFLGGKTDAQLLALGYATDEVTLLRNAFTDLRNLQRIYNGNDALATAYDFAANAKNLQGVL
jgi:hypothetical protein